MKTFSETLDEARLKDALIAMDSTNHKQLKDAYYDAVAAIAKAKEILSKTQHGSRVTPFTKEANIFQNLFKVIDKSDLGKFL